MSTYLSQLCRIAGTAAALIAVVSFSPSAHAGAADMSQVVGIAPTAPVPALQKATGTAVIRGHVVDAATGRPLRRALIRATAAAIRANQTATTDDGGLYEIRDLPAGQYAVSAGKQNYVGAQFGQVRQSDRGTTIEVRDGQAVEKIDFSLARGGVITGRVVDEFADPVPNVQVAVMRSQFSRGLRRLVGAGQGATTDDLGEYRIFGLNPGEYFVSATYRAGPIVGGDDDAPGYGVTYVPGTLVAADAQRVTVAAGQSIDQINIALVPVKTAQISGSAVDSHGNPMAGFVSATERGSAVNGARNGGQLRPDGTFVIRNLAPGEYVVRAEPQFKQGTFPELASAIVSVAGRNIDGVHIVAMPPSTVSGRIVIDPSALEGLKASTLMLAATVNDFEQGYYVDASGRVKEDLTFEVKAAPGNNTVRLMNLPDGLVVRAIRYGGADVTDTGFNVKPNEDVSGIEVELTNHPTIVSGQVTDAKGAPVKECTVVVFGRDEQAWAYPTRRIRSARSDRDGQFKITGLPSGDYFVAVSENLLPPDQTEDPEVLKGLRGRATTLSLNDGETKTLTVKTTGS
jgi:hypothetical protein